MLSGTTKLAIVSLWLASISVGISAAAPAAGVSAALAAEIPTLIDASHRLTMASLVVPDNISLSFLFI